MQRAKYILIIILMCSFNMHYAMEHQRTRLSRPRIASPIICDKLLAKVVILNYLMYKRSIGRNEFKAYLNEKKYFSERRWSLKQFTKDPSTHAKTLDFLRQEFALYKAIPHGTCKSHDLLSRYLEDTQNISDDDNSD